MPLDARAQVPPSPCSASSQRNRHAFDFWITPVTAVQGLRRMVLGRAFFSSKQQPAVRRRSQVPCSATQQL